jgi:hypothetical protein
MSIYPVPIKEWYLDPENAFHSELENLRQLLPEMKCAECGKPITEEKGWVDHSVTFQGYYPDMAHCSKECLKNGRK